LEKKKKKKVGTGTLALQGRAGALLHLPSILLNQLRSRREKAVLIFFLLFFFTYI
jgi:hypothetical protein